MGNKVLFHLKVPGWPHATVRGGRGVGGSIRLLFILILWPLTTHSFRDGAPGGWGGGTHVMHSRNLTIIYPRVSTMPGRSMSGFQGPGRHI